MTVFNNTLLLAGAAATGSGYQISRSLRFNSNNSSYCVRSFGTPTTQGTFTLSMWVKRAALGSTQRLFGVSTNHSFGFTSGDTLNLTFGGVSALTTTAVFRDPVSWYHIVWRQSSTSHTLYVNNVSVGTVTATSSVFNTAVAHQIGSANTTSFFNGYLADIHFIDGQALTPSSFGEFDVNGEWQPKAYISTYGTNGFHLDFADNSAATAAALGKDTSGNNNNWTPNNLSIASLAPTTFVTVGTTTASGGSIANGGTPFWIDVLPANASLAYSGAMANVHDNSLTTYTYWVGDEYTSGNVLQARLDLRSFSTVTSVRIYGRSFGAGYVDYSARLLNSSKVVIGGTTVSITATTAQWVTVPVSGSPRYLEIFTSSGIARRVELYAIEINGVQLINNIPISASDSFVDSPTSYGIDTGVGGEVRGNYCTINPLIGGGNYVQISITECNLAASWTTAVGLAMLLGTIGVSSGKWYWETTIKGSSQWLLGVAKATSSLTNYVGSESTSYGYTSINGNKYNSAITAAYGNAYNPGDIIGVALDLDAGRIFFSKNGVWQNSGDPVTGSNPAYTGLTGTFFPAYSDAQSSSAAAYTFNFGQSIFSYAAPTGFKTLCDTNLPDPIIAVPSTVMDAVTYTGTGATLTPTNTLKFAPDLVWIKSRSSLTDHTIYDFLRGTQSRLESNTVDGQVTSDGGLTAFNSDGFTLGTLAQVNTSGASYVAWCWDLGSSNVVNTQGSISSTVRANISAGASVVTYTGTSTTASTVGHGLGVAPQLIIVKRRNSTGNWQVRHISIAAVNSIQLNLNNAPASASNIWNGVAPSSTVFTLGADASVNATAGTYVAYCFSAVAGYSDFGTYTGDGSGFGPFIYTGFRPRWIMIKQTTSASLTDWMIFDSYRDGYNVDNDSLSPNLSDAEGTKDLLDITSSGFKLRFSDASVNVASGTYIYAAFAESPFKYSRAR